MQTGTARTTQPRHPESRTATCGHGQRTLRSGRQGRIRCSLATRCCRTLFASVSLRTGVASNHHAPLSEPYSSLCDMDSYDRRSVVHGLVLLLPVPRRLSPTTATNSPHRSTLPPQLVSVGLKRLCFNMVLLVAASAAPRSSSTSTSRLSRPPPP
jgi:hypothetical protein